MHCPARLTLLTCCTVFLLSMILFAGCTPGNSHFHIKDLAKSNIDQISELHMNEVTRLLKRLTIKLYKKNPSELKKNPGISIEDRINQIFTCPGLPPHDEIENKDGVDAILLGFEPGYPGDRVFALMYGLYTMIHKSYNNKCELFMLDYLDEQKLYNSARNIEVFVWRLKTRTKENGECFILSNSLDKDDPNLSFERLFGKLISLQDTMAKIISKRTGRAIKEVIRAAGMAFLPIGI